MFARVPISVKRAAVLLIWPRHSPRKSHHYHVTTLYLPLGYLYRTYLNELPRRNQAEWLSICARIIEGSPVICPFFYPAGSLRARLGKRNIGTAMPFDRIWGFRRMSQIDATSSNGCERHRWCIEYAKYTTIKRSNGLGLSNCRMPSPQGMMRANGNVHTDPESAH